MGESRPISVQVTHIGAHAEELAIAWMYSSEHFREQSSKQYPGIGDAPVYYWNDLPQGTTREQWEAQGYLFYGRWGSEFDEHSTLTTQRKEGESALSLAARELGVIDDPRFKDLVALITHRDLNLGKSEYEFPSFIKMMYDLGWSPSQVMEWAFLVYEAIYLEGMKYFKVGVYRTAGPWWGRATCAWLASRFAKGVSFAKLDRILLTCKTPTAVARALHIDRDGNIKRVLDFAEQRLPRPFGNILEPHAIAQIMARHFNEAMAVEWAFKTMDVLYRQTKDFFEVAAKDFENAEKRTINIGGQSTRIVIGRSSSRQFNRFARSSYGNKAGVVLMQDPSNGNVGIFTNTHLNLDLSDVAAMLRITELRKKGADIPRNLELLRGENELPGGDVWYFFKRGRQILNGSTTRELPPTCLDLRTITGILFAGLHVKMFENLTPEKLLG